MTKKDILELKKRFTKNGCTFTKLTGCYVNSEREIILEFDETFLNLEDDEFFKYLEIAKKSLSGTIGNNLLELEFPLEEEKVGGKQQFLMGLKESRLKNPELLRTFYQLVIDNYSHAGNYLILLFHDSYDVISKTNDNLKLDESEEVYEYLICAVCPVSLSKPGLGYLELENRIGPRNRDWVVEAPDTAFIFPAFTDRSSDIHSLMFYTKDAKEPHIEFIDGALACPPKRTGTQQKNAIHSIISDIIPDEYVSKKVIMEIHETINQMVEEQEEMGSKDSEPILLTNHMIKEILDEHGIEEEITQKIETEYNESFQDEPIVAEYILDSKLIAAHEKLRKEEALVEKVIVLQEELNKTRSEMRMVAAQSEFEFPVEEEGEGSPNSEIDVVVKVKADKVNQISTQIIDGKKCIIIPMEEDEHITVNGQADLV